MAIRILLTGRSRTALIAAVRRIGRTVESALAALGAGDETAAISEGAPGDRDLATIRHAQRAALAAQDYPLARRLGELESTLQRTNRAVTPEPMAIAAPGRGRLNVQLEDMRQRLLASTPRPGAESVD